MPDFNRWLHEEMQTGPLDGFMDELDQVDYRQQEIARRADLIRDSLSGRDRQDTNQPPQPFVLFGKPIDSTNFDEVLVAAATWGEMQSFLLRPSGLTRAST